MEDILNKKTGQNEVPKNTVAPAKVKIVSVVIKEENKKGEKMDTPLAQFFVKHPDKEELLALTKMKILVGDKLMVKSFWVQTDDEGNFYKGSSIDEILKYLKIDTLAESYGKEIDTVKESEESPYLCFKVY